MIRFRVRNQNKCIVYDQLQNHFDLKETTIQDLTPLIVAEEKGFENFEVKALAIVVVSLITPAVHAYSAQKSTISDRV